MFPFYLDFAFVGRHYTDTEMMGNMQIYLVQKVNSDVKTFAKFTGIKKNVVFPQITSLEFCAHFIFI